MKHDYSKALALFAVWGAVAVTAMVAPDQVKDVAGYATGATAMVVFFV